THWELFWPQWAANSMPYAESEYRWAGQPVEHLPNSWPLLNRWIRAPPRCRLSCRRPTEASASTGSLIVTGTPAWRVSSAATSSGPWARAERLEVAMDASRSTETPEPSTWTPAPTTFVP